MILTFALCEESHILGGIFTTLVIYLMSINT